MSGHDMSRRDDQPGRGPRTFLVWRYNTTSKTLVGLEPVAVEAASPQEAADRFFGQALVVEAHVGDPRRSAKGDAE